MIAQHMSFFNKVHYKEFNTKDKILQHLRTHVCTELGLGRILEMDGADRARVELTCVNVRVNL